MKSVVVKGGRLRGERLHEASAERSSSWAIGEARGHCSLHNHALHNTDRPAVIPAADRTTRSPYPPLPRRPAGTVKRRGRASPGRLVPWSRCLMAVQVRAKAAAVESEDWVCRRQLACLPAQEVHLAFVPGEGPRPRQGPMPITVTRAWGSHRSCRTADAEFRGAYTKTALMSPPKYPLPAHAQEVFGALTMFPPIVVQPPALQAVPTT